MANNFSVPEKKRIVKEKLTLAALIKYLITMNLEHVFGEVLCVRKRKSSIFCEISEKSIGMKKVFPVHNFFVCAD